MAGFRPGLTPLVPGPPLGLGAAAALLLTLPELPLLAVLTILRGYMGVTWMGGYMVGSKK